MSYKTNRQRTVWVLMIATTLSFFIGVVMGSIALHTIITAPSAKGLLILMLFMGEITQSLAIAIGFNMYLESRAQQDSTAVLDPNLLDEAPLTRE